MTQQSEVAKQTILASMSRNIGGNNFFIYVMVFMEILIQIDYSLNTPKYSISLSK